MNEMLKWRIDSVNEIKCEFQLTAATTRRSANPFLIVAEAIVSDTARSLTFTMRQFFLRW